MQTLLKILNVSRFASTFPHRERFSCSKVREAHGDCSEFDLWVYRLQNLIYQWG
jgi:hypothetical protein